MLGSRKVLGTGWAQEDGRNRKVVGTGRWWAQSSGQRTVVGRGKTVGTGKVGQRRMVGTEQWWAQEMVSTVQWWAQRWAQKWAQEVGREVDRPYLVAPGILTHKSFVGRCKLGSVVIDVNDLDCNGNFGFLVLFVCRRGNTEMRQKQENPSNQTFSVASKERSNMLRYFC